MGLEIFIELHIQIDKSNGLPSVWIKENGNFSLVPFDPDLYKVPVEFCKFVNLKGSFLSAYIEPFIMEDSTPEVDSNAFLESYPTWESIVESSEYEGCEEYWTEENHNEFKQALEWFVSKGSFYVHWSY